MSIETPILKALWQKNPNVLQEVKDLLAAGADPNERTKYFETPLRVSSRIGRFDIVKILFDAGADPEHLNWTPLFHAVAYGSLEDVENCLEGGNSITARDTWERTPFLLAVQTGDIKKAALLLERGASLYDSGRGNKPALEYAIQMDNPSMLAWLIERGVSIERYNSFGCTPLIKAVDDRGIECVKVLIQHGADIHKKDRSQFSFKRAINHASTVDIAEVLLSEGADIAEISDKVRAELLQVGQQGALTINSEEYFSQKEPTFGISNPELCSLEFYYDMVRSNFGAWKARRQFDDTSVGKSGPVWCYERFGQALLKLEDGAYLEIGGEHEDHYDPDFYIYNDVIHHKGDGNFDIYQYPKDVFPPTDFHTANLVGDTVYLVGNLGYPEERKLGSTPVFRIRLNDFSIEEVETSGDNPGWIWRHSASFDGKSVLHISGGKIMEMDEAEIVERFNEAEFELNINTLEWKRLDDSSGLEPPLFFPEEYKQFRHSENTTLSIEYGGAWHLLKIIKVYRVDVYEGDEILLDGEKLVVNSDDFICFVAYSLSEKFDSREILEQKEKEKEWLFEIPCVVCKVPEFPMGARYQGFVDVSKTEKQAFQIWLEKFLDGKTITL